MFKHTCIVDQNAYNKVSDTFINYRKKLKLSFSGLGNNDAIIQLSWGIEGDGNWWLDPGLDLLCPVTPKATMIYNSFVFNTTGQAISVCWRSSVEGVICESRLQQIAHTVKFTKLANMITLKRWFIVRSQKLVITYTRPQVRIVSSYFNDNYKVKQNTTINVNRNQKHGPMLHYVT